MKKLLLTLAICSATLGSKAQQVNYKILNDEPRKPWWSLNLDLFHTEMGINNLDGISFNLGFYGYVDPLENLGLDYSFRRSWLTGGQLGFNEFDGNRDLEIGGHFTFLDKIVKKKTKIVLDREYTGSSYSTNVYGDRVETRSEKVTYLMVPARRRVMTGIRAGLINEKGPYSIDDKDEEFPNVIEGKYNFTSSGIYLGLLRRSYTNVFIEAEGWGVTFNSAAFDIFADLLIMPGADFEELLLNPTDANLTSEQVKENLDGSPLGFRIGFNMYQAAPKKETGKMFGITGRLDVGRRPYQGWYAGGSLAITLVKAQNNPFAKN